jgi:hypothetical protein
MRRGFTTVAVCAMLLAVVGTLAPPSAARTARTAWDTTPVQVTHAVRPAPKVVDLRVGRHPAYDRVVVDLQGKMAGYDVRYVDQLRYDGSGGAVPLKGQRFVRIRITPAVAHDAQGRSVYRGPELARYQLPTLRGVAFTGDYEGSVSFGLALGHRDTFRVLEVANPNRLVIDLHH